MHNHHFMHLLYFDFLNLNLHFPQSIQLTQVNAQHLIDILLSSLTRQFEQFIVRYQGIYY